MPTRVRVINPNDSSDFVEFDASLNEDHDSNYEVTEHPIESGSSVSDHVIRQPRTLVIEAIITDFPLDGTKRNEFSGRVKPGSLGSPAQARISGLSPEATGALAVGGAVAGAAGIPGIAMGAALASRIIESPEVKVTPGSAGTPPSFAPILDAELSTSDSGAAGRAKRLYDALLYYQSAAVLLDVRTAFQTYASMFIASITTPRNNKFNSRTIQFTITFREIRIASSQTAEIKAVAPRHQSTAKKGPQAVSKEDLQTMAHRIVFGKASEPGSTGLLDLAGQAMSRWGVQ